MKKFMYTRPFSFPDAIFTEDTYVGFSDLNFQYVEKNFKKDKFYPYYEILKHIDVKLGIREDKRFGTLFLAIPGHIYRGNNYIAEYICGQKGDISKYDATTLIKNKLDHLQKLRYIDYNFESPYYTTYWFNQLFLYERVKSTFCHIYVRGYNHILKVVPKWDFSKASKAKINNGNVANGNLIYFDFNNTEQPINVQIPVFWDGNNIRLSFETTKFQEDMLKSLKVTDKKSSKQDKNNLQTKSNANKKLFRLNSEIRIIKSVFDNRAKCLKRNGFKYSKLEAFFDIYSHTVYCDPKYPFSFIAPIIVFDDDDNDVLISQNKLAARFNWSSKTVKNFLLKHSSFFKVIELNANHDKVIFNTGILNNKTISDNEISNYIDEVVSNIVPININDTASILKYLRENQPEISNFSASK